MYREGPVSEGVAVRDMPEREGALSAPYCTQPVWEDRQGEQKLLGHLISASELVKTMDSLSLRKLPSNKKPLGQLREEKGVKAGAPVDPNRLNQPISCTMVGLCVDYITFIISPTLLHVEHLKDRNILFFLCIPRPDR